jgi:hypothetical protein
MSPAQSLVRLLLLSSAKIAVSIVLAVLLLGALGWIGYAVLHYREVQKNAPLAVARSWPTITAPALGKAQFALETLWRDGRMSYKFRMQDYARALAATGGRKSPLAQLHGQITLNFLDEQGFRVFSHLIGLREASPVLDAGGKTIALEMLGEAQVSAELYRRAVRWEVAWSL